MGLGLGTEVNNWRQQNLLKASERRLNDSIFRLCRRINLKKLGKYHFAC